MNIVGITAGILAGIHMDMRTAVVKMETYRWGGGCRLEVRPLFVVVAPAAVVTGPHGQSSCSHPTMYMARGKSMQLFICSHC